MSLNRRDFIKFISLSCTAATIPLTACTHRKFYNPDQDIVFGGGRFKQNGKLRNVLAVTNLLQQDSQLVDLNFLAHGVIIDPRNKKRLLAFEKAGTAAAEIDLGSLTMTNKIPVGKDQTFAGHGVFNPSGETLFCTETSSNSQKGIISIRDGNSFNILGELPSYGKNPHQCQLINDATTLVVSNTGSSSGAGAQASIAYIDVQSQQLLERVKLDNQQLNAGHFDIAEDGSLIVASAPHAGTEKTQTGGVSIRSGKQAIMTMTQPEAIIRHMTGEALSIAIDNKHDVAAVTHPDANMVSFWSIDKKALIRAISVPDPRGVTLSLNEKSFIISYDINTSIVRVRTKDLVARTDSIIQPSYISGEHLYNWSKILTEIMPKNVY